jgi:hypothetical protein
VAWGPFVIHSEEAEHAARGTPAFRDRYDDISQLHKLVDLFSESCPVP